MEMKKALVWYLVIVVVMAVGVYLGLELFVNRADVTQADPAGTLPDEAGSQVEPPPYRSSAAAEPAEAETLPIAREDIPAAVQPATAGEPASSPAASSLTASSGTRETPAPAPVAAPSSGGGYTIQVAALSARDKAEAVVSKLAADGFSGARIVDNLGDSLNRVWVGSFTTRADAAATAEKLKGKGYNTYVRTVN